MAIKEPAKKHQCRKKLFFIFTNADSQNRLRWKIFVAHFDSSQDWNGVIQHLLIWIACDSWVESKELSIVVCGCLEKSSFIAQALRTAFTLLITKWGSSCSPNSMHSFRSSRIVSSSAEYLVVVTNDVARSRHTIKSSRRHEITSIVRLAYSKNWPHLMNKVQNMTFKSFANRDQNASIKLKHHSTKEIVIFRMAKYRF